MLDENEFLSPYGIRSLSRYHADHPYVFNAGGREYRVSYLPAESDSGMFGGNSNWRGPVWFPVNALLIRALLQFYLLLWQLVQGRVPDRFGHTDESLRGSQGDRRPADQAFFSAMRTAGVLCSGGTREVSERPALARPRSLL